MSETSFNPSAELQKSCSNRTTGWKWLKVKFNPRAHLLRGVAGHAGLFSTADDLTRYVLSRRDGQRSSSFGQATYSI